MDKEIQPEDGQNTANNTSGLRPPWKPGESGNPGGRPKTKLITEAYRALLDKPFPGDPQGRTGAELIALAMLKEAIKGKVNAASELADRIEGKAAQSVTLGGDPDNPVTVRTLSDFYASIPKPEK
jgi:hypothetical protein